MSYMNFEEMEELFFHLLDEGIKMKAQITLLNGQKVQRVIRNEHLTDQAWHEGLITLNGQDIEVRRATLENAWCEIPENDIWHARSRGEEDGHDA